MSKNPEYVKLINTATWRQLRLMQLRRHPLCQDCAGRGELTAATEVHHTVPVETGLTDDERRRLCYSADNLRSLCHRCHVEAHRALGRSGAEHARGLRQRRRGLERAKLEGAGFDALLPQEGGVFLRVGGSD